LVVSVGGMFSLEGRERKVDDACGSALVK
jgi:hypothetical protein